MTTTEYITKPGERWDTIANKAYGTIGNVTLDDGTQVNAMAFIIRSNPGLTIDDVLSEGLLIRVPVIATTSVQTEEELLPPWKR